MDALVMHGTGVSQQFAHVWQTFRGIAASVSKTPNRLHAVLFTLQSKPEFFDV